MIRPEAFLSLERSIAATMDATWAPVARKVHTKVLPILEQGWWDDAHDIANRLTLFGVVENQRKRLEELAVSAFLFGAHHVTGNVGATSFVQRKQEIPYALQQALDQLTEMVEAGGGEQVRNQLHALIRDQELGVKAERPSLMKADMDLADRLNAAVLGTGKSVIDIAANMTTSRLITLGFLSEAMYHKIDVYQVNEVLDSRTCAVCQHMHGKTFNVTYEYHRVLTALSVMDPQQLKSLAPWPKQNRESLENLRTMTPEQMQTSGFGSPPFHPMCRGMLALADTVTDEITLGRQMVSSLLGLRQTMHVPDQPRQTPDIREEFLREPELD